MASSAKFADSRNTCASHIFFKNGIWQMSASLASPRKMVWRMSTSLASPRKTVWQMLARLVILSYFPKRLYWRMQLIAKFAKFAKP